MSRARTPSANGLAEALRRAHHASILADAFAPAPSERSHAMGHGPGGGRRPLLAGGGEPGGMSGDGRPPFELDCRRPILTACFPRPQRMLSWSPTHPGFTLAGTVAWIEVAPMDLPPDRDPGASLARRLAAEGLATAVGLVTGCDVRRFRTVSETADGVTATVVTTVDLGSGLEPGRASRRNGGSIATLVHVSVPLSDAALVETIALAAQARTVAVLETSLRRGGDLVTGTEADCLVVACPPGGVVQRAGLGTAVGAAVGTAVAEVTRGAVSCWFNDFGRPLRRPGDTSMPPFDRSPFEA